jgi:hypothetical protein
MMEKEKKFIKDAGAKWHTALCAATMHVRMDNRFVGLDKVREPIAHAAALAALGGEFPEPGFIARLWVSEPTLANDLSRLIEDAAASARQALEKGA